MFRNIAFNLRGDPENLGVFPPDTACIGLVDDWDA